MQLQFQTPVNSDLTVLWENPSPTSALDVSTVELAGEVTNYRKILIEYKRSTGTTALMYISALPIIGETFSIETTTGNQFSYRYYKLIDSKHIQIMAGNIVGTYGVAATVNNGYVIVTKILGMQS